MNKFQNYIKDALSLLGISAVDVNTLNDNIVEANTHNKIAAIEVKETAPEVKSSKAKYKQNTSDAEYVKSFSAYREKIVTEVFSKDAVSENGLNLDSYKNKYAELLNNAFLSFVNEYKHALSASNTNFSQLEESNSFKIHLVNNVNDLVSKEPAFANEAVKPFLEFSKEGIKAEISNISPEKISTSDLLNYSHNSYINTVFVPAEHFKQNNRALLVETFFSVAVGASEQVNDIHVNLVKDSYVRSSHKVELYTAAKNVHLNYEGTEVKAHINGNLFCERGITVVTYADGCNVSTKGTYCNINSNYAVNLVNSPNVYMLEGKSKELTLKNSQIENSELKLGLLTISDNSTLGLNSNFKLCNIAASKGVIIENGSLYNAKVISPEVVASAESFKSLNSCHVDGTVLSVKNAEEAAKAAETIKKGATNLPSRDVSVNQNTKALGGNDNIARA